VAAGGGSVGYNPRDSRIANRRAAC
jgi:hypothetical protein